MNQITSAEFNRAVEMDPAWASKLTEPVEITDYCDMRGSGITHLSPLLTFSGRNEQGKAACFRGCKSLKIAEGTFHGFVNFMESGIEIIGDLNITQPDEGGFAARFRNCKSLKIAEGIFPGCVNFIESGIEKIGELNITQPDKNGEAAYFAECKSLKIAEGTFPGSVDFAYSGIEKIGDLNITQPDNDGKAATFIECQSLTELSGNFSGSVFPPLTKVRLAPNFKATDFGDSLGKYKAGWEPLLKKWPPNPNNTKSLNEILGILKNLEEPRDLNLEPTKKIIKDEITQRLELLKKIMSKQEQAVEIELE